MRGGARGRRRRGVPGAGAAWWRRRASRSRRRELGLRAQARSRRARKPMPAACAPAVRRAARTCVRWRRHAHRYRHRRARDRRRRAATGAAGGRRPGFPAYGRGCSPAMPALAALSKAEELVAPNLLLLLAGAAAAAAAVCVLLAVARLTAACGGAHHAAYASAGAVAIEPPAFPQPRRAAGLPPRARCGLMVAAAAAGKELEILGCGCHRFAGSNAGHRVTPSCAERRRWRRLDRGSSSWAAIGRLLVRTPVRKGGRSAGGGAGSASTSCGPRRVSLGAPPNV